jgi:prevent-host-death family protein
MENNMITYAKDEMVGITELGKSLGSYLDKVTSDVFSRIAIIRRNKPEAVIIPIEEYELLQSAYDRLEQQEIEMLLKNMSDEEKEVASTKVLSIDI